MNNKKLLTGATLLSGVFVLASCVPSTKSFKLTFTGENCYVENTTDYSVKVKKGDSVNLRIVPKYKYNYPTNLVVQIGGKDVVEGVDYIYNTSTHTFELIEVTADVTISAVSKPSETVTWSTYTLKVPTDNFEFGLGSVCQMVNDGYIEWGDNTSNHLDMDPDPRTTEFYRHTYAKKGTYYVNVYNAIDFGTITYGQPHAAEMNDCVTEVRIGSYINIGATYDVTGHEVVVPDDCAADCVNCTKVTFDEGVLVTIIGANAFRNTKIEEIVIPGTTKQMSYGVFRGCSSLKTIDLTKVGKVGQEKVVTISAGSEHEYDWDEKGPTLPYGDDDKLKEIIVLNTTTKSKYLGDSVWNKDGCHNDIIISKN